MSLTIRGQTVYTNARASSNSKPKLLDLFSGAGGATRGYQQAGFYVVGVDINPQPHYCGDEFYRADALTFPLDGFDAIHASPPCQAYSHMSACRPGLSDTYPALIEPTRLRLKEWARERMTKWGLPPYVIENVPGAPLLNPTVLCGAMFGRKLYRHRLFESSVPIVAPYHPHHEVPSSKAGHWKPGTIISVAGNCAPMALAREAMGIDWMTRAELVESIPPIYTAWIGRQFVCASGAVAA